MKEMKYLLKIWAIGHNNSIEISEENFHSIESARNLLSLFSSFTENYRVVLNSYRRLELSQHELSLDHMLFNHLRHKNFLEARVTLNTAIIGYLTSTKFFHDWSDKHLPTMIGPEAYEKFSSFRSKIYDDSAEYRFIEALRNYVQHRNLPIETISYHNFIEDKDNHESSDWVTTTSLLADREKLKSDQKFKKKALNDLPEKINIIQCIRAHMSGIWEIHNLLIVDHSNSADESRSIVETYRERFKNEVGGKLIGLHAVAEKEGETVEKIPLLLEWDDARREALKQIGNLKKLSKTYVSGKIKKT
jgi:hypothetical protein